MFDLNKRTKIEIEGKGVIVLDPKDHVSSGGEGHIFRPSNKNTAVKIWDDSNHALNAGMAQKIAELKLLKHPYIVAPQALVRDAQGEIIGFSMEWLDDAWHLPLAFTNDWRANNSFTETVTAEFSTRMKEVVEFAHARNAVIGDGNELNVMGSGKQPRYIDVDSWSLPGFPGDKILPSIYDFHSKPFSKQADWFAWAVVTFQLFTGIHPYRGTHPNFKRNDLAARMKQNTSVFSSDVRLSAAVRSFNIIPPPLLDWYKGVFEKADRSAPPSFQPAEINKIFGFKGNSSIAGVTGNLRLTEIYHLKDEPFKMVAADILQLKTGCLVNLYDGRRFASAPLDYSYIRLSSGEIAAARVFNENLETSVLGFNGTINPQSNNIAGLKVWNADNRMFLVTKDGLLEIQWRTINGVLQAFPANKWNLSPNATFFGNDASVYDALGAKYMVIPFSQASVAMIRVKELDGFKILTVLRKARVCTIQAVNSMGEYWNITLVFSEDYSLYSAAVTLQSQRLEEIITWGGVILRKLISGKLELEVPVKGVKQEVEPGPLLGTRLFTGPSGLFAEKHKVIYQVKFG